jgi:hypothetical protein
MYVRTTMYTYTCVQECIVGGVLRMGIYVLVYCCIGGESPHEYAEAEELFPEVASSSDNKHSHSEYPLYDDVLPAQTSHLRYKVT